MKNLKFNHIGVATKNINEELKIFEILGYKKESEIFIDENQGIKGIFISAAGQPTLELLENLNDGGPLNNLLKKGIKFYHLAYESQNIEEDISRLEKVAGAIVVSPVKIATYYKKVAFLLLKNRTLIELVEIKE